MAVDSDGSGPGSPVDGSPVDVARAHWWPWHDSDPEGEHADPAGAHDGATVHLDALRGMASVRGILALPSVPKVTRVLGFLAELRPRDLTLDLHELTLIDSAGAACLADFGRQLAQRGARLRIVRASVSVRLALVRSGLVRPLHVC